MHEFVHLLQDRQVGLAEYQKEFGTTFDAAIAVQALVEARQKIASAKAEAEALALQKTQVTNELLTLRRIENEREAIRKWDGRLPTTTGGAVPFINLGGGH